MNKYAQEKVWFSEWVIEGYSVRQLIRISRRGIWKIKQIINYWLNQEVPDLAVNFAKLKYLIFDGTYFNRKNCFLLLLDGLSGKAVDYRYRIRENYAIAHEIFQGIRDGGGNPIAITTDGNTSVIRALKTVWPDITIQRCLAHIQRQGLSWLRRYPKLEASKELRKIYLLIFRIEDYRRRDEFLNVFLGWERRYGQFVKSLPAKDKVYSDLQRARSLLLNAGPDMFHYLDDQKITPTTNLIEGYFSTLKGKYKQHHGLSKINRPKYLSWYIYLKNKS